MVRDVSRQRFRVLQAFDGFSHKLLVDFMMALRPIRGVGYQIIPPREQTDHGFDVLRGAVGKALHKCEEVITCINTRELTQAEMRHNAEQRAKLGSLRAMNRKALTDARGAD
jgi:hypothetical protein